MAMSHPDPQQAKREAEAIAKQVADEEVQRVIEEEKRNQPSSKKRNARFDAIREEVLSRIVNQNSPVSVEPPQRPEEKGTSNVQDSVISYGQQLQYERGLRGWTQEQLAAKIGVPSYLVQQWEENRSTPDRTSRRELAKQLGNDYSLSSEVLDNGDLQVRVVQIELTAHDFTTIIKALTEFYTQFWLLQQGRIDDLVQYAKTQDGRFVKEANLVIDSLASNSPALITLLTDPGIATSAVTSTVTLAVALQKAIDAIVQVWVKVQNAKIDTRNKEEELRKKEVEERRKLIMDAVQDIVTIVDKLNPGADQRTKEMERRAILPKYLEFLYEKGPKLDLPTLT